MFIIDWILNLFRREKPGTVVQEPEPEAKPVSPPSAVAEEPVVEEKLTPPQPLKAEPKVAKPTKAALGKLTKKQLEEKGRELGIELDLRKRKADLVNEVHKQLK